jgi:hypothetical protein
MAKYITVLNSDLNKTYWKAIQWDNSLASIRANRYYTAGVNMNLPKSANDNQLEGKTVIETSTSSQGAATIINIAADSVNSLKLANNKASKTFLKNIES